MNVFLFYLLQSSPKLHLENERGFQIMAFTIEYKQESCVKTLSLKGSNLEEGGCKILSNFSLT